MIKMIYLCRRLPEITREEYARLVLEDHAPLAIRHHPTMRRYVINIAEGTPSGGPEIDSLPALYFESLEDVRERLIRLAGRRINEKGILIIEARRFRTQERNRTDARERLVSLIRKALVKPKPRRKTRPKASSKERRLETVLIFLLLMM